MGGGSPLPFSFPTRAFSKRSTNTHSSSVKKKTPCRPRSFEFLIYSAHRHEEQIISEASLPRPLDDAAVQPLGLRHLCSKPQPEVSYPWAYNSHFITTTQDAGTSTRLFGHTARVSSLLPTSSLRSAEATMLIQMPRYVSSAVVAARCARKTHHHCAYHTECLSSVFISKLLFELCIHQLGALPLPLVSFLVGRAKFQNTLLANMLWFQLPRLSRHIVGS